MFAKLLLLTSAFLFAAAPAPAPPLSLAVPSHQILAAVACLLAEKEEDDCAVVPDIGHLGDRTVRTIGAIDDVGNVYYYFILDDGRFGVTVENPQGKLIILMDANLDGRIESTSKIFEDGTVGMAAIAESDSEFPDYQNMYWVAMAFIDQIAPPLLLDSAKNIREE